MNGGSLATMPRLVPKGCLPVLRPALWVKSGTREIGRPALP